MDLKFIDDYISKKIEENEEFVKFSFYELRVKSNLTIDQANQFLHLAKNKFENLGYNVYFIGDEYEYKGSKKTVEDNVLLVAIKK